MIKFTQHFLEKLEDLFLQSGYKVRYEKGNFKSGFCILDHLKVVVVNKFAVIESKISFLTEALQILELDEQLMDDKAKKLYRELKQTGLHFSDDEQVVVDSDHVIEEPQTPNPKP